MQNHLQIEESLKIIAIHDIGPLGPLLEMERASGHISSSVICSCQLPVLEFKKGVGPSLPIVQIVSY